MSGGSLAEKLEHSAIIDILQIGVYAYLGFALYQNLGFNQDDIFTVSMDPTVLGFQLAAFMIAINLLELLHDKIRGGGNNPLH